LLLLLLLLEPHALKLLLKRHSETWGALRAWTHTLDA